MPDSYRDSRVPLVTRARKIGDDLQQGSSAEIANAQQIVQGYEDQTRAAGTQGQYPVANEVARVIGRAAAHALTEINSLADAMAAEEVWSKEDADRRLSELNAAKVEVDAIPSRTWTRFVAGTGSSILVSGSALLAAEEARIWPRLPALTDWSFYLAPVVVYAVGGLVLVVALYYWSLDDAERRLRYEKDFVEIPQPPPGWGGRSYSRISSWMMRQFGRK